MEVTYICKVNSTHVNCAYKIIVMCFREVVLHIGQSETVIACGFHVFDRSNWNDQFWRGFFKTPFLLSLVPIGTVVSVKKVFFGTLIDQTRIACDSHVFCPIKIKWGHSKHSSWYNSVREKDLSIFVYWPIRNKNICGGHVFCPIKNEVY